MWQPSRKGSLFPAGALDYSGPGLTSPGKTAEMWLKVDPGQYIIICWERRPRENDTCAQFHSRRKSEQPMIGRRKKMAMGVGCWRGSAGDGEWIGGGSFRVDPVACSCCDCEFGVVGYGQVEDVEAGVGAMRLEAEDVAVGDVVGDRGETAFEDLCVGEF